MSKGIRIVIALLVIVAAVNALKFFSGRYLAAAEAHAKAAKPPDFIAMGKASIAQQEAEAVKRYPNLPREEALQRYGQDRARAQLAGTTGSDRVTKAAQLFHGFYIGNTMVRAKWCAANGGDLAAFMSAFRMQYGFEATLAQSEITKVVTDIDHFNYQVSEAMKDLIDRDMRSMAAEAGVPPNQVCAFLNEHALQIVPNIPSPPGAREILRASAGLPREFAAPAGP